MRARISNWWENALSSFWLLPAVMTLAGLLLALALPRLEAALAPYPPQQSSPAFGKRSSRS